MKAMKRNILYTITTLLIAFSIIISNINLAFAESTVNVSVHSSPKVEILLTTNETSFNLKNFEPDLKSALEARGIDTTNITFQALEQKTSQTDSTDLNFASVVNSWTTIGAPTWTATSDGQIYSKVGPGMYSNYNHTDPNIRWSSAYNAGQNGWWGTGLINPNEFDTDNIELNFTVVQAGQLNEGACFFVTRNPNGSLNGYFFNVSMHVGCYNNTTYQLRLWKMTNYQLDKAFTAGNHDYTKHGMWCWGLLNNSNPNQHPANYDFWRVGGKTNIGGEQSECLAAWTLPYASRGNIQYNVTAKDGHIVIKMNNNVVADVYDSTYKKGTYGFWGNNCEQVASMYLKNFNVKTEKIIKKSYSELLNAPTWSDDATHIIVNADESLDTTINTAENIAKTLRNNIYFIQWGSNANEQNITSFINSNDKKGLFVKNKTYQNTINDTADYIASLFNQSADSQYVIVGQDINLDVTPESYKVNAVSNRFPNGRWMIHHDYTYYDNTLGQSNQTEMYNKDLICSFDKPGKYDIYFDDELVKTVYAHRAPTADFTIKIQNSNITLTSLSQDKDSNKNIGYGTGIKSEKWYYKEASATSWVEGKLTNFDSTKTYMIKLEVEDFQGATASTIKYTGTGNPVATFSFDSKSISKFNTLAIQDTSYDPSGYEITGWEWTLYKNGKKVNTYTTKTPEINFNKTGLGAGEYKYSLKVKNSQGKQSAAYTQAFTITEDFDPPEVIITPTFCEDVYEQDIDLTFQDLSSGFYRWRYCFDENQESPASTSSTWSDYITSNTKTLTVNSDGFWYLHIEAFDIAGNKLEKTVGIYKIQHEYTNTYKTVVYGFNNNEGLDASKISTTVLKTVKDTKKYGEWTDATNNIYDKIPNGTYVKSFTYNNKTYEKEFKQPSGNLNVDVNVYPIDYKITYNLNGGTNNSSNPSTYNVFYGVTLKNPTRDGYTFAGWTLDGNKVTGINEGKNATFSSIEQMYDELEKRSTGNIILNANWQPITYTNTFDFFIKNGSNDIKFMTTNTTKEMDTSFTIKDNYLISAPNGTAITNTFYSDVETKNSFVSYTMPKTFTQRSHVATFKFYFTPITYNITYKFKLLQDGNLVDISNVSNSNTSTYNVLNEVKLNTPTYQTYDFDGWFLDEACTKRVTGINVGKTSNIGTGLNAYSELASRTTGNQVLYGKFRPHRIQIDTSIVSGYGSVSNTQYLKPGDSTTIYYIPASGYDIEYVELDGVKDSSLLLSDKYTFQNTNVGHTVNVKFKITKTKLAEITNLAFNWIDLNIE